MHVYLSYLSHYSIACSFMMFLQCHASWQRFMVMSNAFRSFTKFRQQFPNFHLPTSVRPIGFLYTTVLRSDSSDTAEREGELRDMLICVWSSTRVVRAMRRAHLQCLVSVYQHNQYIGNECRHLRESQNRVWFRREKTMRATRWLRALILTVNT